MDPHENKTASKPPILIQGETLHIPHDALAQHYRMIAGLHRNYAKERQDSGEKSAAERAIDTAASLEFCAEHLAPGVHVLLPRDLPDPPSLSMPFNCAPMLGCGRGCG